MAEFQTVMRQAARMCKAHDECEECPVCMIADMVPSGCLFGSGIDSGHVEEKIMGWAAENPEPRYPSWDEAWKMVFPTGAGTPCPADFGVQYKPDGGCSACRSCEVCRERPFPADIAEKLGIKPVGGANDA